MKKLVEKGEETVHKEPPLPKQEKDVEEAVAIWKMKVKREQDKMQEYDNKKEKVFSSILGKCDDTVITRLESMKEYQAAEEGGNVAVLMGLIKKLVVGASDRVYPGIQAANAWKTLGRMHQHDDKSLLKYYRRFMAAVEHVEDACGKIKPEVLTQNTAIGGDNEQGWDQFLACMFITGSNKSKFEGYKKKLADDYAGDQVSRYPETVEAAVTVMQAYLDNHGSEVSKGANFAQVDLSKVKCFKCKKMGHYKRDCPEKDSSDDGDGSNKKSVDIWGGTIEKRRV